MNSQAFLSVWAFYQSSYDEVLGERTSPSSSLYVRRVEDDNDDAETSDSGDVALEAELFSGGGVSSMWQKQPEPMKNQVLRVGPYLVVVVIQLYIDCVVV